MASLLRKPDVKGFAISLRRHVSGTIYDVIIRYFMTSLLMTYWAKGLPKWLTLFRDLLQAKSFLLIVLDDARYDVFKALSSRYLSGTLRKVVVPPPHTYGWIPKAFSLPEFKHIRIFYGSLGIRTHDIKIKDFVPDGKDVEVHVVKPKSFSNLKTVLPSEINDVIRRVGLRGRDIIWYTQPHFPWVCDPELSLMLMHEALIHDYLPPDIIKHTLKKRSISRERILKAYFCNMELALKGVKELLEYVCILGLKYERIVVTSDHGEMLGEFGLYLHQEYNLPQLTIVPWLEVRI